MKCMIFTCNKLVPWEKLINAKLNTCMLIQSQLHICTGFGRDICVHMCNCANIEGLWIIPGPQNCVHIEQMCMYRVCAYRELRLYVELCKYRRLVDYTGTTELCAYRANVHV